MSYFSLLLLRFKKLGFILSRPRLLSVFVHFGILAGAEHKVALKMPLKTVVDIGANRGQFALAAREVSGANVIAFEPLPQAIRIFKKIFLDDPAVKLHESAIGNKSERKSIHLSASDDSSSFLEIGDLQIELFPGTHEVGTIDVRVGTLDEFLSSDEIIKPAMLKLDVQGFEMQALAGCKTLIGNFDYIYCECSFIELYKDQKLAGEVIAKLGDWGFMLMAVYNPTYDGHGYCVQADLLFSHKLKA